MKKTLLSLCLLIVMTISAEAQIRPPRPHYRHQSKKTMVQPRHKHAPDHNFSPIGELRFQVFGELGSKDLGAVFMHEIPYHFSVGGMAEYQVGHITSVGIGGEYYSSYGEHCHLFHNMQETYIHTLPVYANLKFALPDAPISPFVEGRIGYSAPLGTVTCNDADGVHRYMATGLYTGGAVGLKIFRTNLSFGVSVIDIVDADQGYIGGRKDLVSDYYVRLSFAF